MQYAFKNWETLEDKLKGKYIFLFLDYDGTLTPIVEKPELAVLSGETREILKKLSEKPCCKVAIISGRSLQDVKSKLGLRDLIISGNHGLEIEGPKIQYITPISGAYRKILDDIKIFLGKKIIPYKGASIEDKGLALTLHFRQVPEKLVPMVKAAFHEAAIYYLVENKIKIKTGKKVLEVRPILQWDKGDVVLWLLARQKFAKSDAEVLPVYIGDDNTDEDAFKALQDFGVTIFVGKPGASNAQYYVGSTDEVRELLERILKIQEKTDSCKS
ncbi:MAG TPA: trehalose-phosphatase [Candidatus Omnitrophota bacterium]|nr:trehalose-phosphatase [Candidatus Omnitrophota bacterium]